MSKTRKVLSIIGAVLNLAIIACCAIGFMSILGIFSIFGQDSNFTGFSLNLLNYFWFYTTILLALASLFCFIGLLVATKKGKLGEGVYKFKFVATISSLVVLGVTLIQTINTGSIADLFKTDMAFIYVIAPAIALVSLVITDSQSKIRVGAIFSALLPLFLYGLVYTVCFLISLTGWFEPFTENGFGNDFLQIFLNNAATKDATMLIAGKENKANRQPVLQILNSGLDMYMFAICIFGATLAISIVLFIIIKIVSPKRKHKKNNKKSKDDEEDEEDDDEEDDEEEEEQPKKSKKEKKSKKNKKSSKNNQEEATPVEVIEPSEPVISQPQVQPAQTQPQQIVININTGTAQVQPAQPNEQPTAIPVQVVDNAEDEPLVQEHVKVVKPVEEVPASEPSSEPINEEINEPQKEIKEETPAEEIQPEEKTEIAQEQPVEEKPNKIDDKKKLHLFKKKEPKPSKNDDNAPDKKYKDGARVYHIARAKDGSSWQVKLANGEKAIKIFNTQAEAIDFANDLVSKNGGSIRVHSMKGSIRKA